MLVSESKATNAQYREAHSAQEILLAAGESLQIANSAFAATVTEGFQPSMLAGIANGKIPALHMQNAVDPAWCDQVAEQFKQHPATQKEGVTPPIYSLGTHLYSCPKGEEAACYFQGLEQRNEAIASVLPGGYDPIVSFLQDACRLNDIQFEYLSHNGVSVRHGALRMWGEGSQTSTDSRCYFAVPHEDYEETNAEHPLPQIHDANNVYSIILCIDAVPDREPETIVWDRRMTLEEIRTPHNKHAWASYGYNESLVEGVDSILFRLKKGDAAIIPAHNIHAVIGYPGFRRCTYMAFFHFIKTTPAGFSKMVFRT